MNKQETILKAIGLTEEEVYSVVFETAIEYLEQKASEWAADVSQTKTFWIWWKYQWAVIDEQFCSDLKQTNYFKGAVNIRNMWIEKHRSFMYPKQIPETVWRDSLKLSYGDMMKFISNNFTEREAVTV